MRHVTKVICNVTLSHEEHNIYLRRIKCRVKYVRI